MLKAVILIGGPQKGNLRMSVVASASHRINICRQTMAAVTNFLEFNLFYCLFGFWYRNLQVLAFDRCH